MKKFLMMVLAVALAAAPAFAGDVSVKGKYQLWGFAYNYDNDDSDGWYANDFELVTTVTSGDVSAVVDFELIDVNNGLDGYDRDRNTGYTNFSTDDIIDQYWITAKLMEGLTLKTGSYYLDWGIKAAISKQGGYNIGLAYSTGFADLGLTIFKIDEDDNYDGSWKDSDLDAWLLTAAFKNAGPFTKLNAYAVLANFAEINLFDRDLDWTSATNTMLALEFALPAGPVALSGEFGFLSGDFENWTYLFLDAGFKLGGFNVDAIVYYSTNSEDGDGNPVNPQGGEYFQPLMIFLNDDYNQEDATNDDRQVVILKGGYALNDKLSFGLAIMPLATAPDADITLGMEVDLSATYKFSDNLSWMGGVASFQADADYGDYDTTLFMHKLTYTF